MKRIFIILCALTIIFCSCFGVLSVSAAENDIPEGYTVLDYLDYVTEYDFTDVWTGYAYFRFGQDFFTSTVNDVNGTRTSTDGNREWSIVLDNDGSWSADSTAQFPGGFDNLVFLDLSNIYDGSILQVQALADVMGLDTQQSELKITINCGISYFDDNFVKITDDYSEQLQFTVDEDTRVSQLVNMTVHKPDGARYCTMYSRINFGVERSAEQTNTISIDFQWDEPNLMVSTTYTQIIVESIIQANRPSGSGTVDDLGSAEGALKDQSSAGLGQADQIITNGSSSIVINNTGFLFMTGLFDKFASLPFFSGLLYISLGLGIFSFLCNIAVSVGSRFERNNHAKGGKAK